MTHRLTLAAVRVKSWDETLGCNHVRLIGFRVVCSCGQHSQVKRNPKLLALWRDQHLRRALH